MCVAAGGFVFLFHKGIPIPFHPLQRTEKVPPEDRESLRAWLMMARDVMHRDVDYIIVPWKLEPSWT